MKTATIKELEQAIKSLYGDEAELEMVEPIICLPYGEGSIEEVASFEGGVALIFHKQKFNYDAQMDTIDLVKRAQEKGEVVALIPKSQTEFLGKDSTERDWNRICVKYGEPIFVIPHLQMDSVAGEQIDVKKLKGVSDKRELKRILKEVEKIRGEESEPDDED